MFAPLFRRFAKDRKASVAIIFALTSIPMIFMIGMGVDYALAEARVQQLDAAADAAALAAVRPTMLTQNDAASTTAATTTFNAQAALVDGIGTATPTIAVADTVTTRAVTVSFTSTSQTIFSTILGSTIPISGSSQATGRYAPNINFYMLLDDSPSMAIGASQSDIDTMVSNTSSQGGCAFACHESHPSSDSLGNPGGEDNYALARALGVTLRIDLLKTAAQNITTVAKTTEAANNSTYKMAIYTFDTAVNTLQALTSNMTTAKTSAGNVAVQQVYANNWLTSSNNNSDTDTDFDTAMTTINTTMPNPGNGTSVAGDTPQEVLFLVSDGVEDENVSGSRQQSVLDTTKCDTIKNRGIRIAVLYTEYLPLPTNDWYNTYIDPFQSTIDNTMQSCASSGLYYKVQTGGDISAALTGLFNAAVQTAHLTK